VPVVSGRAWEEFPGQHHLQGVGSTPKLWLRDADRRSTQAVFKYANDEADRNEMYALGFERVAYRLAEVLGLPVPDTHLESFDGHRGVIQVMRPNIEWSRNWNQAKQLAMFATIENEDLWPLCVAFDLWIANVDRAPRNLVFEPVPPDKKPTLAASCVSVLPDHGHAGLHPPGKFGVGDVAQVAFDACGRTIHDANVRLRELMPDEYVESFTQASAADVRAVLDQIRAVPDDAIRAACQDVASPYFNAQTRNATFGLLKARRDAVDTLAAEVF
jgi:hypothetical protein